MKRIKVLHTIRVAGGGAARVLDMLVRGMAMNTKGRYTPAVLFYTEQRSPARESLECSGIESIEIPKFKDRKLSRKNNPGAGKKNIKLPHNHYGAKISSVYSTLKGVRDLLIYQIPSIGQFVEVIKDHHIGLMHIHSDLRNCKPEIIAAQIAGVPCVVHNHRYSRLNYLDLLFAWFVDHFIYISSDVAAHYTCKSNFFSKGSIVHNSIEAGVYLKPEKESTVRKEWNVAPNEILIGLLGRIVWWKGQQYFIEAIAKVSEKFPCIKGVIVGAAPENASARQMRYFRRLQDIVASLGLKDRIIFAGFRTDVPLVLDALDVMVHASSTPEPFGLVILEGMAAGKPVVATAAGGVLDIIEDGQNGLLVPPMDSGAIADAISRLITDKGRAMEMGLAARKHVLKAFTVQRQVESTQEIYDQVIAGTRAGK